MNKWDDKQTANFCIKTISNFKMSKDSKWGIISNWLLSYNFVSLSINTFLKERNMWAKRTMQLQIHTHKTVLKICVTCLNSELSWIRTSFIPTSWCVYFWHAFSFPMWFFKASYYFDLHFFYIFLRQYPSMAGLELLTVLLPQLPRVQGLQS